MDKSRFLGTYRRVRVIYHGLPPRERVGMTPERLATLAQAAENN